MPPKSRRRKTSPASRVPTIRDRVLPNSNLAMSLRVLRYLVAIFRLLAEYKSEFDALIEEAAASLSTQTLAESELREAYDPATGTGRFELQQIEGTRLWAFIQSFARSAILIGRIQHSLPTRIRAQGRDCWMDSSKQLGHFVQTASERINEISKILDDAGLVPVVQLQTLIGEYAVNLSSLDGSIASRTLRDLYMELQLPAHATVLPITSGQLATSVTRLPPFLTEWCHESSSVPRAELKQWVQVAVFFDDSPALDFTSESSEEETGMFDVNWIGRTTKHTSIAVVGPRDAGKSTLVRSMTINTNHDEMMMGNYYYTIFDQNRADNIFQFVSQVDTVIVVLSIVEEMSQEAIAILRACVISGKSLIVAINKFDHPQLRIGKSPKVRFTELKEKIESKLSKIDSRAKDQTPIVPINAALSENVIDASFPWFDAFNVERKTAKIVGKTLADAVAASEPSSKKKAAAKPVKFACRETIVDDEGGVSVVGRLDQGLLKAGDEIHFLVSECRGTCQSLHMHGKRVREAGPGDNLVVGIACDDFPAVGDVMIKQNDDLGLLQLCVAFTAKVFVRAERVRLIVDNERGSEYNVIVGLSQVRCRLSFAKERMHGDVAKEDSKHLETGDVAVVTFTPLQPFFCAEFLRIEKNG